jgi:hypothetical protein
VTTTDPKPRRPPSLAQRTFLPVLGGIGFLAVLAGLLWLVAAHLAHNAQKLDVRLGAKVFDVGRAADVADSITSGRAPLAFPDPRPGGDRDIFVNHLDTDPTKGWVAFEARPPGEPRRCNLVPRPGAARLTDPCTGTTFPLDGTGLPALAIEVNSANHVVVDFTKTAPRP